MAGLVGKIPVWENGNKCIKVSGFLTKLVIYCKCVSFRMVLNVTHFSCDIKRPRVEMIQ
jgi:hypothetical protein